MGGAREFARLTALAPATAEVSIGALISEANLRSSQEPASGIGRRVEADNRQASQFDLKAKVLPSASFTVMQSEAKVPSGST